jgi:hypothetical protein
VFSDPRHLLECLEVVRGDADVRVLHAENRLRVGCDAAATGGHRDVVLSLRVDTEETRRLGVETHVCEVRLGLAALEKLAVSAP